MIGRRPRPRPLPPTRVFHPRREQRLRVRRQPLDPIERHPNIGHITQRDIGRLEPIDDRREQPLRQTHIRQSNPRSLFGLP